MFGSFFPALAARIIEQQQEKLASCIVSKTG
jgi:hypothetical protein